MNDSQNSFKCLKPNRKIRNLLNYWELDELWQAEAQRNLGDDCENHYYIEPEKHQTPEKHILFDLSDTMRTDEAGVDGIMPIGYTGLAVRLFDDHHGMMIETWSLV